MKYMTIDLKLGNTISIVLRYSLLNLLHDATILRMGMNTFGGGGGCKGTRFLEISKLTIIPSKQTVQRQNAYRKSSN